MTLGEFIKIKRTETGMSQRMLAAKTGISHTEVQRIETNKRKMPSLKVLCALADALNIPQEDLLKIAGYVPSKGKTITYLVHINNVSFDDYGTNDPELILLTKDYDLADKTAHRIVNHLLENESNCFLDPEWDGEFVPDYKSAIIFWDKQENWNHYTEVIISKMLTETDYSNEHNCI